MSTARAAAEAAAEPTLLLQASQVVNLVVLVAAVVALGRRWRAARSDATGWALAMFAVLASIVLLGFFHVEDDGSLLRHGYIVVLVSVLLLVPYLLVRFVYALGALGPRAHRVAAALTVAQVLATFVAPQFPEPGAPRSAWFTAYVVLILVAWVTQSVLSAAGLWSAGRGQPGFVRHRMRTLSLGVVVLALSLVTSSASNTPGSAVQVIGTLMGVLGVCLLVLAFLVPSWLRAAWRAEDLVELGVAERRLMAAVTADEVARAIVPAVVRLFGGEGGVLLDGDGAALAATGIDAGAVASLQDELRNATTSEAVVRTHDGGFACPLSAGWLVVHAGRFAPVFGPSEISLLDRVGSLADLALQRCRLFEQEADSRRAAEAAGTELQTLVYSVSHDLRNPIISVLGYLDVLSQEHAGELTGDGPHYLERISVNALYMQSLIQDLLELSRIGRSDPPPQAVAIGALADSVAQEVRNQHPGCQISLEGSFPVLWMSELRARQLLTNLIDNAAKHAQGPARVIVRADTDASRGAVLLVMDNGPGIAPAYRDKAFEVFERLDAARTDIPGTGMGLPICKRIVESLGGAVSIEGPPSAFATGTTIRITLPPAIVQGWSAAVARVHDKENA